MRCSPVAALPLLAVLALSACGGGGTGDAVTVEPAGAEGRLDVVVGLYPYEYVAQRVGGDDVTVSNLTAPGVEPHDLELSPQQVAALAEADLVLYSAGFQPAVDEAVAQQAPDSAFDVLSAVEVRSYDDAEGEDAHGHGEEEAAHSEEAAGSEAAHGEEGHDHGGEDPHVWLDPTRLSTIADAVAAQLSERAPDKAEQFQARADELEGRAGRPRRGAPGGAGVLRPHRDGDQPRRLRLPRRPLRPGAGRHQPVARRGARRRGGWPRSPSSRRSTG
jgi:zinc transport system substrate-binding protein